MVANKKPEAPAKKSHLDDLLKLNERTKFSEKGEAKGDLAPVETPVTQAPTITTVAAQSAKEAGGGADVSLYPWMKEGLDQEKASFMLNLPSDQKLFLQRISRLMGDKESVTSVLLMCIQKEMPSMAAKFNLPLPKSVKTHG